MGGRAISTQTCVDDASESKTAGWAAGETSKDCTAASINRQLDGSIKVSSTCKMPSGGSVSTDATASGDWNSHYTVHVITNTTGAPMAQLNGQHVIDVDAKWLGPCPAGMKGGDATFQGGKINITQAMKPQ
jgi:hypothetical protein